MAKAFGFTQYGDTSTQEFMDLPEPTPGPGELLLKVHAAAVNPIDWKIRQGLFEGHIPVEFPAVLGRAVAGVVDEVGQDVDGFAVGDQVLGAVAPGSGGYAEFALIAADSAAKKPPQVSFIEAASLPVAGTAAYDMVSQLQLSEGQTLLINGIGGGVGIIAAQIARDQGVNVIGTASEGKRALVESVGATLVTYDGEVEQKVRQILPDGVDAILDLVGGDALRNVARLTAGASIASAADPQLAAELGGAGRAYGPAGEVLTSVAALVADGKLDPHVLDVRPLDEAAEALAGVESGHSQGNSVIQVR